MPADDTGSFDFDYNLSLIGLSESFNPESYILKIYVEDSQGNKTDTINNSFDVKLNEKPIISDVVINQSEFNLNNETKLIIMSKTYSRLLSQLPVNL